MIKTVVFSLISILFTIGLGYYAADRKAFNDADNQKLVKLIMRYALPLSIFAGLWATPRKTLVANVSLMVWLLIGMVGSFIALIVFFKLVRHLDNNTTVLRALSIAEPSIPFIGSALLPFLLSSHTSAITIGTAALITNVIMLPITLAMLSANRGTSLKKRIINDVRQPLVYAAFAGFLLSLLNLKMPLAFTNIFMNLGKAAGGLAMFSIGILLATHRIMANWSVSLDVITTNLLLPILFWVLMILFRTPTSIQDAVVIALAIPTASLPAMLSVQYKTCESEIASVKFWSTLSSFITIIFFLLLIK